MKDGLGLPLKVGDAVAYAHKTKRVLLGVLVPLGVSPEVERAARDLYCRIKGPTGYHMRDCNHILKVERLCTPTHPSNDSLSPSWPTGKAGS